MALGVTPGEVVTIMVKAIIKVGRDTLMIAADVILCESTWALEPSSPPTKTTEEL